MQKIGVGKKEKVANGLDFGSLQFVANGFLQQRAISENRSVSKVLVQQGCGN